MSLIKSKVIKPKSDTSGVADMPITEHLIELRARLIKICIAIGIALVPMLFYFQEIYSLFAQPLLDALPPESRIIAPELLAGFMAQVQLCILLAIFLVIPYILYQVWSFVAPGLYKHEKRIAVPILLSSIVLFYLGISFCYFVILQRALMFLVNVLPATVVSMPDMKDYLQFATKMLMAFGLAFEIPVVVFVLVASGVVSIDSLKDKRRYVIVGCFAVAGIMSPPDVPSMFMLALPMMLLFELGLFMAGMFGKPKPSIPTEQVG